MQCQELLPKGQVFENEVFAATGGGDNSADEVSDQYNHGKNRNRSRILKLLILRVHEVLMMDSQHHAVVKLQIEPKRSLASPFLPHQLQG